MKRRYRRGGVLLTFRRKLTRRRLEEFAATGHRLERERRAAEVVERLLRTTPRDEWPTLAERPELQTAGALERLGNTVAALVTKEPVEALAVAELAVATAEGLAPRAYPLPIVPQLRAHAWKDLGKALRFLGRNREALDAFDKAEGLIEGFMALEHDRAIVRFNRAMSLQEVERFDEARALLADSKEVFDDHGDDRNAVLCGLGEGALLHRLRRYREAREVYFLLFTAGGDLDTETRAALHRVIGLCSIELGDFREAEANLLQAAKLHTTLGQPMEIVKDDTMLGRLYLRRGETERAVDHLRPLRRELLKHRLTEEAGICGLEIVEGLLVLGRASAAEKLAQQIVSEFTGAGFNRRAITALAYLKEAITANRASTKLATEVREYIISLRTSPERDFVATR